MPMKLMFSWRELLAPTPEYARKRWGGEPELAVTDGPFPAGGRSRGYAIDDPRIEEFEGTITQRDDEAAEFVYLTVTNAAGTEREFGVESENADEYEVGRHMLVRFIESGRLKSGDQLIEVTQIWLA
jgi:hypothetical protein